jgi:hypothetical protein
MASEKFLKRLMGRTEVEDALDRLDTFTKEETLMAVTRNLGVMHHVDGNVMAVKEIVRNIDGNVEAIKEAIRGDNDIEVTKRLSHDIGAGVNAINDVISNVDSNIKGTKELAENVDDNVKATKALTEDISDNVKMVQGIARSIDHNVKATKHGTHRFLSVFIHVPTVLNLSPKTVTEQLKCSLLPNGAIFAVNAETCLQGSSCFEHGSQLQIRPSITISHAKLSMEEPQRGLSKAAHSETGRRTAHCCGSMAIVRPLSFLSLTID